jgi:ABC-type dipeptide/oligopeptide/nickel transport system ATPase component
MALALKWVLCLIFVTCITNVTIAQTKRSPSATQIEDPNKQIAHILFEQIEFAKANILLEDIVNADPSDELSYNRYMICLVKLGEQDKAIKWIKKRIKKAENPLSYVVDECWINTTYPDSPDKIKHTQRAEELLQRFDLSEHSARLVGELPGGVRKLLDIAMALTRHPKVLLLDEPTSGVSADEKFPMMETVMRALSQEAVTVLFVEHDMDIVERFADRVIAFYSGRIIADDKPDVALSTPDVQRYVTGTLR